MPRPKCRVRLQRGRQQQPAHENERRGARDAAAAMRSSNAPQNHPAFAAARVKHTALSRQAQRTAQHARRCSSTCTFLTRHRVTRSIIHPATRPVVLEITCIPAGIVASRWHAVATQPHMTRTGTHGENSASMQPRGGGGSSRCRFMPDDCRAKNHAAACMSSSGRMICTRCSSGDCSLPSTTRTSDTGLPVR